MTIRAKFASSCRACGGAVEVGTEVEWEKGKGVTHLPGQCAAARVAVREEARESFSEGLPGKDAVPAGRYAVDNGEGVLRFYRVARGTRNPDRVWLHVQHGPSESEVPFSWAGYRAILGAIAAEAREAAIRYGREIGACSTCGKRLTNALSRELGIGPVCGGRFYAQEGEWKATKDTARKSLRQRGIDPDSDVADDVVPYWERHPEAAAVPASAEDYVRPVPPTAVAPSVPATRPRRGHKPRATDAELAERYGDEVPF